jgi:exodeoxyribonuclease-1
MATSFFWYDLETTGISPRTARIMQFAGQRTDLELNPIGEPVDILIRLSDDVLPEPEAIMITGITPQSTLQDGITEAAFMKLFYDDIATADTIFVGYNTVRFDDEFMRFMNYRNFYDAYEWQWQNGRSRWDLLDLVRMTRALRPDGINWPVVDGKPTNRLELLTKENGLDHEHAHDALNDVLASIAVARLIREKQPKLFDWLLNMRSKDAVKKFLATNTTCIYTSNKYPSETEKTAVVHLVHSDDGKGAIVYDLLHDPTEFAGMSAEELADRWRYNRDPDAPKRLPVKTMKYNRCPALAPTGLLSDSNVQQRLHVTPQIITENLAKLTASPELLVNILKARDLLDDERGEQWSKEVNDADAALYDGGFFDDNDRKLMSVVRAAEPTELERYQSALHDSRLQELLPRYKARNYPKQLTDEERLEWEEHRFELLMSGGQTSRMAKYMERLAELKKTETDPDKQYLLDELQLYAESIMPILDTE